MAEAGKPSLMARLKRGLFMTHTELVARVGDAIKARFSPDPRALEALEEALLAADVGPATATELVVRQTLLWAPVAPPRTFPEEVGFSVGFVGLAACPRATWQRSRARCVTRAPRPTSPTSPPATSAPRQPITDARPNIASGAVA